MLSLLRPTAPRERNTGKSGRTGKRHVQDRHQMPSDETDPLAPIFRSPLTVTRSSLPDPFHLPFFRFLL